MITESRTTDGPHIHTVTANAGVFTQEEVECVDELWEEYQAQGPERSGYFWLINRDEEGRVLGYSCYGPRALTIGTYDLYWIAVDPTARRGGVGRELLAATEKAIHDLGGRLVFVETSGLPKYEATRKFYIATGYLLEATIKDFYTDGDDLVIFTKRV
jgi:ribosomal protein S18 acetylase RimI-like enzyme